ncbi:unnamed protein product [Gordionus sp. m RMFG-2023]
MTKILKNVPTYLLLVAFVILAFRLADVTNARILETALDGAEEINYRVARAEPKVMDADDDGDDDDDDELQKVKLAKAKELLEKKKMEISKADIKGTKVEVKTKRQAEDGDGDADEVTVKTVKATTKKVVVAKVPAKKETIIQTRPVSVSPGKKVVVNVQTVKPDRIIVTNKIVVNDDNVDDDDVLEEDEIDGDIVDRGGAINGNIIDRDYIDRDEIYRGGILARGRFPKDRSWGAFQRYYGDREISTLYHIGPVERVRQILGLNSTVP